MMKRHLWIAVALMTGLQVNAYAADNCAYEVPVRFPELEAYKCFELERVEVRVHEESNAMELNYDLPAVLVGRPSQRIHLEGRLVANAATQILEGTDGRASCTLSAEGVAECLVDYARLDIDEVSADAVLADTRLDDTAKAKIREVRTELNHQAMGIVRGLIQRHD